MGTTTWTHPPLLRVRSLLRTFNHFPHRWDAFARDARARKGAVPRPAHAGFAFADTEDELARDTSPERPWPSLGQTLRQARQASGLSLGQVSAALRIRERHLRAIEAGDYTELPAPAYATGFIRSYAAHLDLDGDELVRRFKRETEGEHLAPDLVMPLSPSESKVPRGLLIGLLILGLCGYGIWHYRSPEDRSSAERVAEVPPSLMALTSEPAPTPTTVGASATSQVTRLSSLSPAAGPARASDAGPLEAKASPLPARAPASAAPATSSQPLHIYGASGDTSYRIALRASAETWLEVKDGESSVFQRLMQTGDEYRLPEKPGLVMRIGNASGIEVLVDGKPLPDAAQPSQRHRTVVNLEARELLARAGTQ